MSDYTMKIENISNRLSELLSTNKNINQKTRDLRQDFISQKDIFGNGYNQIINDLTQLIDHINKKTNEKEKVDENKAKIVDEEDLSPASNL